MKKLLVISILALGLVFATSPAYSQSGVQIDVGAALQGYSTTTVTAGPGGISSSIHLAIKWPCQETLLFSSQKMVVYGPLMLTSCTISFLKVPLTSTVSRVLTLRTSQ